MANLLNPKEIEEDAPESEETGLLSDVNAQTYRDRDSPLHLAIKELKPTMVNFLLKNGANPEIPNRENKTCVDLVEELRNVRDWDKRKHLIVRFMDQHF